MAVGFQCDFFANPYFSPGPLLGLAGVPWVPCRAPLAPPVLTQGPQGPPQGLYLTTANTFGQFLLPQLVPVDASVHVDPSIFILFAAPGPSRRFRSSRLFNLHLFCSAPGPRRRFPSSRLFNFHLFCCGTWSQPTIPFQYPF